jgi:hypothetical protein
MLFGQIFLYYYIIKVSPRLTLYHIKDKKGVGRLTSPYHLKNYGSDHFESYSYVQSFPAFLQEANSRT